MDLKEMTKQAFLEEIESSKGMTVPDIAEHFYILGAEWERQRIVKLIEKEMSNPNDPTLDGKDIPGYRAYSSFVLGIAKIIDDLKQ